MSNPKIEKIMQKNENAQAFTVENIVKKYIETENQYNDSGFGFEYGGGDEIIAQLYKDVAGSEADAKVLSAILRNGAEFYDKALTLEEYDYLKSHFAETVEFVISSRAALNEAVHEPGELPNDLVAFVTEMLNLSKGSSVYLPNAGYGDMIMLLNDCNISGYVNSDYAWALVQIRLYAAGKKADIECLHSSYSDRDEDVKKPNLPQLGSVDAIIALNSATSFQPFSPKCKLEEDVLFDCLNATGKMVLLTNTRTLCGYTSGIRRDFLTSIIQFPPVLRVGYGFRRNNYNALVYDKSKNAMEEGYDFIDLTSTGIGFEIPVFNYKRENGSMDVEKALAIINNGKEHVKHLGEKEIDWDILLPTYYFVKKSRLCHSIYNVLTLANYDGFEDDGSDISMPIVQGRNLSNDFAKTNIQVENLSSVKEARGFGEKKMYGCITVQKPCIFVKVETNNDSNNVSVGYIKDVPATGVVVDYGIICLVPREGVSLETAALLLLSDFVQEQLKAVPYAFCDIEVAGKNIEKIVVWPEIREDYITLDLANVDLGLEKEAIDQLQADQELADELALEADKEAAENQDIADQLAIAKANNPKEDPSYQDYLKSKEEEKALVDSLKGVDDGFTYEDYLRSMDKASLIEIVKGHMSREKEMRKQLLESIENQRKEIKAAEDKFAKANAEYVDEVRSRKHDMMPHIKQVSCARKNLDLYILNRDSFIEKELFNAIGKEVANIKYAIETLSTYMEIFSRESKFGTPEVINIDQFFIENFFDGENYEIDYDTDYLALSAYGFDVPEVLLNPVSGNVSNWKNYMKSIPDYVDGINVLMAKDDLTRLCENIINNAVKHGFTDPERTDYSIVTELSVDKERNMFMIDFRNNGNPLPEGLDKQRYGLRGEKAGVTGGTGEGGYIVKSIVEHYQGDYDVFCVPSGDEFLTTIRIYLPIY